MLFWSRDKNRQIDPIFCRASISAPCFFFLSGPWNLLRRYVPCKELGELGIDTSIDFSLKIITSSVFVSWTRTKDGTCGKCDRWSRSLWHYRYLLRYLFIFASNEFEERTEVSHVFRFQLLFSNMLYIMHVEQ